MDYLNQGKILNVGLYLKQGSGHEITVYDYYYNNAGELIFRVYDSNIPQNRLDDMELMAWYIYIIQSREKQIILHLPMQAS